MKTLVQILFLGAFLTPCKGFTDTGCYIDSSDPSSCSVSKLHCYGSDTENVTSYGTTVAYLCKDLRDSQLSTLSCSEEKGFLLDKIDSDTKAHNKLIRKLRRTCGKACAHIKVK